MDRMDGTWDGKHGTVMETLHYYSCTGRILQLYKALQMADARKRAHRPGLVQFLQSTSLSVVEFYRCLIQLANCCNHAVRGYVVWTLTADRLTGL